MLIYGEMCKRRQVQDPHRGRRQQDREDQGGGAAKKWATSEGSKACAASPQRAPGRASRKASPRGAPGRKGSCQGRARGGLASGNGSKQLPCLADEGLPPGANPSAARTILEPKWLRMDDDG